MSSYELQSVGSAEVSLDVEDGDTLISTGSYDIEEDGEDIIVTVNTATDSQNITTEYHNNVRRSWRDDDIEDKNLFDRDLQPFDATITVEWTSGSSQTEKKGEVRVETDEEEDRVSWDTWHGQTSWGPESMSVSGSSSMSIYVTARWGSHNIDINTVVHEEDVDLDRMDVSVEGVET